jgi:hypothetical protein
MAGKKEAKQKAGPSVKQRRIEKKPEVPQERGIPQGRAGREQPRRSSHRLSKNKGPKRAPKARGRLTEKISKKAGRPSRR